ncbi:MAG: aminopeptidase [Lachnospiraceae bacterium]|nr:aminopeptidase [Lachnospiraceae bacterium]
MSDEDIVFERWLLATTRLIEIKAESESGKSVLPKAFADYFAKCASFMITIGDTWEAISQGGLDKSTLEQLAEHNAHIYEDVTEENYAKSFANPEFAVKELGEELGKILCAVYFELRKCVGYAFDMDQDELVIRAELLLEVYGAFMANADDLKEGEEYKLPESERIRDIFYWFNSDYADEINEKRIKDMVCHEGNKYVELIENIKDFSDVRYLYRYGLYISENEIETAKFIAALPEETIETMANTYTEGYRIGFEMTGKDISIKSLAEVLYPIGFERMIAKAIKNLRAMGLSPVIRRGRLYGGEANRQFFYDHKDDKALYFDRNFITRNLEANQAAFEKYKKEAKGYAGPAVVESFGEKDFDPVIKKEALHLSDEQNKLYVEYITKAGQIQRKYIIEEERSFTIIAFPIPEIRECLPDKSLEGYAKFFEEIIKVNTLDYKLYQGIQQKIIDVLDKAEYVEVTGRGDNKTNIRVHVWKLDDPAKQTKFENCVADVNIPVGEVFTSPVLKGTNGKLHVSRVFLNGLEFRDLELDFEDGMIKNASCSNYKTKKENDDYISENILFRHDTLPIGEFAIGTNTTAYTVARKYKVEGKLPILIAEKTGPHFAVGDTCYSHAEDIKVYNPDKKEIVSRTNEIAELRNSDPAKAYFNCHTDITIPYDELGDIVAVSEDGTREYIIKDGRFAVPGSEKLNEALD